MSTEKIARYISETTYDNLPQDAVRESKRSLIDCVGVTLAGCAEAESKLLVNYVRDEGGKPESGVICGGFKAPASEAAWVNGTNAHLMDYDDVSLSFMGHATVAILPAALAVGEKLKASGKDILLSYIVGFEIGARIGSAAGRRHYDIGWHTTATIGSVSAAATAAKLLQLDTKKVRMALGIAASLAGGLKENFGSMTKPLHAGNAARNGAVAALLAQRGFTANTSILEAPQGFCRAFGGGADFDLASAVDDLGKRYDIVTPGMGLKPYPSCAGTHPAIDAALYLREKHHPQAADITEIECHTSPMIPQAAVHSRPTTGLEGKFSTEFCVAMALLKGSVELKDFTSETVNRPDIQGLIQKTRYVHPAEMEKATVAPQELIIKLKDGKVLSHRVNAPKGDSRNPLTWDEVAAKYGDCASLSLPTIEVEHCLELLSNLEAVDNITTLMDIFTFKSKAQR